MGRSLFLVSSLSILQRFSGLSFSIICPDWHAAVHKFSLSFILSSVVALLSTIVSLCDFILFYFIAIKLSLRKITN